MNKEARFKEFYEDEIMSLPLDDQVCEMVWNEAWDIQQAKINQLVDVIDSIDSEIAVRYYNLKNPKY